MRLNPDAVRVGSTLGAEYGGREDGVYEHDKRSDGFVARGAMT